MEEEKGRRKKEKEQWKTRKMDIGIEGNIVGGLTYSRVYY